MKTKLITALFCVAIAIILMSSTSQTQSPCDSPYVGGHTGAPGETGCNGCHAGTPNTGAAILEFNLGTTSYTPGQTYQGFVRIQQSGLDKFGFSCLALKNSDNSTIGSFGLIENVRTRTYADGNRNYVSHTPCGADSLNANSWSFTWTAPNINQDTITLYIGALAANRNHATSGDFSYSRKIVLPVQITNGIDETESLQLPVFPNPASNMLIVEIPKENIAYDFSITDINGKVVLNRRNYFDNSIDISRFSTGVYYLQIKTNDKIYTSKFIKQ